MHFTGFITAEEGMIVKSQPNIIKRRLLLVQKLLCENTDEQHPMTTFEILDCLQEQDIVTSRKTLKGDIDLMVESGMDIITVQSKPNKYFWGAGIAFLCILLKC